MLVLLALVFVKENLDDYANEKTSISVDREPILGHPTIGICPTMGGHNVPNLDAHNYGTDINITFFMNSNR